MAAPSLCHRCVESIQAMYGQLPAILSVLDAWKGGLRGESGEAKVSTGKSEAPCPLNVGVVDLEADIIAILDRVGNLRVADLVKHIDGVWWASQIRATYLSADGYIGMERHWSKRHAACPDCDQRSLGSYAGEDLVRCQSCGTSMNLDDYAGICLKGK